MKSQTNRIEYFDRQTGALCRETVMGDAAVQWAYLSLSGKICAPLLFGTSLPSRVLGWYFNSPLSKSKIQKTISALKIDTSEFATPPDQFRSFNHFFIRKLKSGARPIPADERCLLSPADGRLLVYGNMQDESPVHVKGVDSPLRHLFDTPIDNFNEGDAAVIRLCPADYHRFHFPCDGRVTAQESVKGQYHSVNPMALRARKRIFCRNKRAYALIETEKFGEIAFMEIGAFGVAGIHQTYTGTTVQRMQEKGYFDFGGSTIVLLFQKNRITFDADLLANSAKGIETLVKAGEQIALPVERRLVAAEME
ncbi:MAG: phosphatidylserine decarboxylase [Kiritimatiellae bacterium]|nr:phosphatidylserine decarboxylase [Kiritimatiellia bacterium]